MSHYTVFKVDTTNINIPFPTLTSSHDTWRPAFDGGFALKLNNMTERVHLTWSIGVGVGTDSPIWPRGLGTTFKAPFLRGTG